jgi:hypothetical protein
LSGPSQVRIILDRILGLKVAKVKVGAPRAHGDPSRRPEERELEGRWRAKKRKTYGVRIRCRTRRAPLGAPQAAISSTGPRFPLPAMAGQSASSWQGLIVVPGGAPMPPECGCCVIRPRAPRPVPLLQRLAKAPFVGRGGASVSEVRSAGIKRGQGRNLHAEEPPQGSSIDRDARFARSSGRGLFRWRRRAPGAAVKVLLPQPDAASSRESA